MHRRKRGEERNANIESSWGEREGGRRNRNPTLRVLAGERVRGSFSKGLNMS
jgi:hypothetical protein